MIHAPSAVAYCAALQPAAHIVAHQNGLGHALEVNEHGCSKCLASCTVVCTPLENAAPRRGSAVIGTHELPGGVKLFRSAAARIAASNCSSTTVGAAPHRAAG